MRKFEESELILNPDGSVYHLQLTPQQVAPLVILVGDPGRVQEVSKYFDSVEDTVQHREFHTQTGRIGNTRVSCISTGIGTDNIDIVFNELDALVNIDLQNRVEKDSHTSLKIVRIGTTGSLQADIPVDAWIASSFAIGLDGLMNYYDYNRSETARQLETEFVARMNYSDLFARPYAEQGSDSLIQLFQQKTQTGITLTAPGFYAPQGRHLRVGLKFPDLMDRFAQFRFGESRITNFEMETAGIYGMGRALGHEICSLSAVVANRFTREFSTNPAETVDQLISFTLEKLTAAS